MLLFANSNNIMQGVHILFPSLSLLHMFPCIVVVFLLYYVITFKYYIILQYNALNVKAVAFLSFANKLIGGHHEYK